MNNSILLVLKDSVSSRAAVEYLSRLPFCKDDMFITLIHVFRKPSVSEELMGKNFIEEESARCMALLKSGRDKLAKNGFNPENIDLQLVTEPYPTIADGIIDQFKKGKFSTLVLGHKKKSKAEEFVKGDVSMKLLRALEGVAILSVT